MRNDLKVLLTILQQKILDDSELVKLFAESEEAMVTSVFQLPLRLNPLKTINQIALTRLRIRVAHMHAPVRK